MSKFTTILSEARQKRKMAKIDVANLFGWTPMYYGRYENGYLVPKGANIERFAKFIGISTKELETILQEDEKEKWKVA